MNHRKPKWSKWNLIDDATVWQVVALSLDIDPDTLKRDASDWMAGGSYVNHEGEEFKDRLDVIKANYSKIDSTPKTLSMNGIAYCELNITRFSNWAMSVNLAIPNELKQRANCLVLNDTVELDWSKYRCMSLWSEAELQAMLCGLSPNAARSSTVELNDAIEQIRRAVLAKDLPCTCPSDATAADKLYAHDKFFKPDDAIAWAGDKFSKFPFKGELISKEEKPLSTRTENNYLRLIMQLAFEIKGFNPKKHYEAAKLIIDVTGTNINQKTLAGYLEKAYELESKERE